MSDTGRSIKQGPTSTIIELGRQDQHREDSSEQQIMIIYNTERVCENCKNLEEKSWSSSSRVEHEFYFKRLIEFKREGFVEEYNVKIE